MIPSAVSNGFSLININSRYDTDPESIHSEFNRGAFPKYSQHDVNFSLRLEARLLGTFAFSSRVSRIAEFLGRRTGAGGEIIVLVWRQFSNK